MTDDRAADIQARLAAATPGPWRQWPRTGEHLIIAPEDGAARNYEVAELPHWEDHADSQTHNAAFIANAPADIDWLLQERARLTEDGDRLRAALQVTEGLLLIATEDRERMRAQVRDAESLARLNHALQNQTVKENARLRVALEAVEWVRFRNEFSSWEQCPWCWQQRTGFGSHGHAPDCSRQAALKEER